MSNNIKFDADIEEDVIQPGQPKHWKIGTLTYTAAGIAVLFSVLLAGDFIWSLRERSVVPIMQLLFKKFGASDFLNGLMLASLPCLMTVVLCPAISYHSDRHRGRWGRRIPYLLATTPIVVLGMIGMAFAPRLAESCAGYFPRMEPNEVVLLFFAIFWAIFEFGAITGNVVFSALINDVVPHQLLGRFYGLFRILSLSAGIIFNYWFFGFVETHYAVIFISIGVIYGIGFTFMCFKVKEGEYPPPPELPEHRHGIYAATCNYFHECFKNRFYWPVFLILTGTALIFMPINFFGVFYAKKLNVPMDHYGKYIAWSYVVSIILSYPLGILADRFHPLRCGIVMLTVFIISVGTAGFFIHDETTFAIAFIMQTIASGTYFTLTASLPMRLFPRSRFAQFNSVAGILGAGVHIFSAPAIGKFLDYTNHDYRYTYFLAVFFGLCVLMLMLLFYRNFKAHGGPHHYVAPE